MNTFKAQLVGDFLKTLFLPLCFFLLQACSDSQFEKRLADSFDTPLKADISLDKAEDPKSNSSPSIEEIKDSEVRQAREVKPKKQLKISLRRSKKFTPHPYRIIIQLSGTNPSAPAEAVTTVLRNAGVVFEIEKIERLDGSPSFNNSPKR